MSGGRPRLHRNVWVASAASFLNDVSSEMLLNVLPLFLANVLGVRVWAVGVVEGVAETTAAATRLWSGWLSDRLRARKWLAVTGYAISTLARPFFLVAGSWPVVAAVRWADRVGKGVRTAPRDALLADSVPAERRGAAFGIHRAADTAGAVVGLLVTLAVVDALQGSGGTLQEGTFRALVLWSLVPAALGVVILAAAARDVPPPPEARAPPRFELRALGPGFGAFVAASALFELGNSSDAFLVLRAQERGLDVVGILWMLLGFNVVYSAVSAPAGALADRLPRKGVLLAGWALYAAVYAGFALAATATHTVLLFLAYGLYQGLAAGATKALLVDLVPAELRGTAFGTYHAVVGLLSLPASLLAGLLWEGIGPWGGFGPSAPFALGAALAGAGAVVLLVAVPGRR